MAPSPATGAQRRKSRCAATSDCVHSRSPPTHRTGWDNPEAAADLSDDGVDDEADLERYSHLWAGLPEEPSIPPEQLLRAMLLQVRKFSLSAKPVIR